MTADAHDAYLDETDPTVLLNARCPDHPEQPDLGCLDCAGVTWEALEADFAEMEAEDEARKSEARAEAGARFERDWADRMAARGLTPDGDPVPTSWDPVDLGAVIDDDSEPPAPAVLRLREGGALLYAGAINGMHGDSGTGKSWLVLAAAAQEVADGRPVMLIDAEANAAETVARLRALGVTADAIREHVIYIAPDAEATPSAVAGLAQLVADRGVTLVGIDSVGEMFGLEGIDENKDVDVAPWMRRVPRPLADAGAAVVLVDHATKANDNPLHPSGSKRKRAAITGAAYLVTATRSPTRTEPGRLTLTCSKDRHGTYRKGAVVATVDVTPYPDGGVTVNLWKATTDEDRPDEIVRAVARRIVRLVRDEGRPMTKNEIMAAVAVKARDNTKRAAIDNAIGRGCLRVEDGPRRAQLHAFVHDYPDDET